MGRGGQGMARSAEDCPGRRASAGWSGVGTVSKPRLRSSAGADRLYAQGQRRFCRAEFLEWGVLVEFAAAGKEHSLSGKSNRGRSAFTACPCRAGASPVADGQGEGGDTTPSSWSFHRRRWKRPLSTLPRV